MAFPAARSHSVAPVPTVEDSCCQQDLDPVRRVGRDRTSPDSGVSDESGVCAWPRRPDESAVASAVGTPEPSPDVSLQAARVYDLVDEWGIGSFPASDPPANW